MTAQMKLDIRVELLRVAGLTLLRAAIEGYHDGISAARHEALKDLMTGLAEQALGATRGRFAYALPCGGGKTQGVVALIAAANSLGLRLTFAVSANTIRALCCIKRDLMNAGVPERDIGLRHSKTAKELSGELAGEEGAAEMAEMADTGDEDRPIMLVSHSRIRGAKDRALFIEHKGQPRSLLMWDETLFASDHGTVSLEDLRASVTRVGGGLSANAPSLHAFLRLATGRVQAELDAQERGDGPSTLDLAEGIDLDAVRKEASSLWAGGGGVRREAVKCVRGVVRLAGRPLAVAVTGDGYSDALIHYTISVDPALTNIAILDASHSIRILAQAGDVKERTTEAMRSFKRFDNVRVRQVKVPAGKSTQTGSGRGAKEPARQAARIIHSIPDSEAVLIVTFKDASGRLLGVLRDEGINLDARVDGRPRISVLTWGNETSTNAYSHCKHVILVGVLRRDLGDLAASVAGEVDDLLHRRSKEQLHEVSRSEMGHCVLQAMHRGNCRTSDVQGQAGDMTLHIIDKELGLQEVLGESLPGVRWETEDPKKGESRTGRAQQAVIDTLSTLPATVAEISSDELKRAAIAASGVTLGKAGWTKAIKEAVASLNLIGHLLFSDASRWRHEHRRLVRV